MRNSPAAFALAFSAATASSALGEFDVVRLREREERLLEDRERIVDRRMTLTVDDVPLLEPLRGLGDLVARDATEVRTDVEIREHPVLGGGLEELVVLGLLLDQLAPHDDRVEDVAALESVRAPRRGGGLADPGLADLVTPVLVVVEVLDVQGFILLEVRLPLVLALRRREESVVLIRPREQRRRGLFPAVLEPLRAVSDPADLLLGQIFRLPLDRLLLDLGPPSADGAVVVDLDRDDRHPARRRTADPFDPHEGGDPAARPRRRGRGVDRRRAGRADSGDRRRADDSLDESPPVRFNRILVFV
ncbi:hypothetical protein [Halalkalicoccus salilacus]|uniref:hypothetical protein n=1 Tax=Halalkalicoccus sp. GCM10025704 TaxID=3252662 RepID=UPI00361D9912